MNIVGVCEEQLVVFYHQQDSEQNNLYKKLRLYVIGRSLETGNFQRFFNLLQLGTFQDNNWQNLLFCWYLEPLYDVMRKKLIISSLFKV